MSVCLTGHVSNSFTKMLVFNAIIFKQITNDQILPLLRIPVIRNDPVEPAKLKFAFAGIKLPKIHHEINVSSIDQCDDDDVKADAAIFGQ